MASVQNTNSQGIKDLNENSFMELYRSDPTLGGTSKLRLECRGRNVNNILSLLLLIGNIVELELQNVRVDRESFHILKDFLKLQLLVIDCSVDCVLHNSIVWPKNVKRMRLLSIEITHRILISTVSQLQCLEKIDIEDCGVADGDYFHKAMENFATFCMGILNVRDGSQRLDMALPLNFTRTQLSRKFIIASDRIRIINGTSERNPLQIGI